MQQYSQTQKKKKPIQMHFCIVPHNVQNYCQECAFSIGLLKTTLPFSEINTEQLYKHRLLRKPCLHPHHVQRTTITTSTARDRF